MVNSNSVTRGDFIIAPYLKRSNAIAFFQVLTTFLPSAALWIFLQKINESQISFLLRLIFIVPTLSLLVLFSSRAFSLMHDCGHGSLFRSQRFNRLFGFALGVLNAVPQYYWALDHAYHHKHNGNWEVYRGPIDVITLNDYKILSPINKELYKLSRHWIMLFPGGFYYLIIKPRLTLILGLLDYLRVFLVEIYRRIRNKKSDRINRIYKDISSYESSYWSSLPEFTDLVLNNIAVISCWYFMSAWLGAGLFWFFYSIIMTISSAILICIFFVQHNFKDSYANDSQGWSVLRGALEGSSNLELPRWLDWFFADISFHSIHHLCDRIPNYNLRNCHFANFQLLTDSKKLKLVDIPSCFGYILWDSKENQLIQTSNS